MESPETTSKDEDGGDVYIPFDSPPQAMLAALAPASRPPRAPSSPFGAFSSFPAEVRLQIYNLLLTTRAPTTWPATRTYGRGSGINCSILGLSRSITAEAKHVLYEQKPHWIVIHTGPSKCLSDLLRQPKTKPEQSSSSEDAERSHCPPPRALALIPTLHVHLKYSTMNRGDAETHVRNPFKVFSETGKLLTALFNARAVRRLHVELLNMNQRKRGPKTIRLPAVVDCMRQILLFFTCLPTFVDVSIGGFDSIQWVELFVELMVDREKEAGVARPERWDQVPWAVAAVWEEIEKKSETPIAWGW